MSSPKLQGGGSPIPASAAGPVVSAAVPAPSRRRRFAAVWQPLLISALLFGLFGEWLYPLRVFMAGDSGRTVGLFLVLTGVLLAAGCLRLPSYFFVLVPPLMIGSSMFFLYGLEDGASWFAGYARLLSADVTEIFETGRLYGISGETRFLLLLIGWTLLVVSVQMLALSKQSILLFFLATLIYLLLLEMTGSVQVYHGLVRSAGWGLALQALLFRCHLRLGPSGGDEGALTYGSEVARVPGGSSEGGSGLLTGTTITAFCVLGALGLSLLLPVQPVRPISWSQVIHTWEEWSGARLTGSRPDDYALSGYSKDDTRLGVPLRLRHETFFTAISPQQTYWRGESKSVYTGRGWSAHASGSRASDKWSPSLAQVNEELAKERRGVPSNQTIRQTVVFKGQVNGTSPLFSGGLPLAVERLFSERPGGSGRANTRFDPYADAVYAEPGASGQKLYGYELTAVVPSASPERLRLAAGADPEAISARELQLPQTLPERVKRLGRELTSRQANRYDAVQAVSSYLEEQYAYSLDTKTPPEGADFVDYFLFEQKMGYCDHFSTAMTVLLRSGGIPARWVKGFAPGTPVSDDEQRYQVSYADAHSWVEVYFPGAGWIPFDPTPGFEPAVAADMTPLTDGDAALTGGPLDWDKVLAFTGMLVKKGSAVLFVGWSWVRTHLLPVTSVLLALIFLISMGVIHRKTWIRRSGFLLRLYLLRRRRRFPGKDELLRAADVVWRELSLSYGEKTAAMTGREYVERISPLLGDRAGQLGRFLRDWEHLYYGGSGFDRTRSRDFLKLCRGLAFPER
ncbi:transglutaminase domain-containing protein [Paenibacillus faecis]|uniref:Transglutaminase domain-containing protein n=1 Tax=Paenibacillus faecis TaxID=862114 RepID=A0A5D0CQ42_9BACL|nr:transglutaminase domain-containing protein [Paenibacillus faecis]TYA11720.1 transglutaminase domain-containing protein [Paenibacillus faecis]